MPNITINTDLLRSSSLVSIAEDLNDSSFTVVDYDHYNTTYQDIQQAYEGLTGMKIRGFVPEDVS